jgi:hypothetical protein
LLHLGNSHNNIEIFELSLQRIDPARKTIPTLKPPLHSLQRRIQCAKQERAPHLLKTAAAFSESQLVSKMNATDKPPLLKMKSWNTTRLIRGTQREDETIRSL